MKKYSNRVLDGQITSQGKKLRLLGEKEVMLKKQDQTLCKEDLAARQQYKEYLIRLNIEKGRRRPI